MKDEPKESNRIRKIIGGVASFFKGDKIVIDNKEICAILPHRGRMLLLDKVTITKKKITGELFMREEICEGHKIGKTLVCRGVEFADMMAQLLGVWLSRQAVQYPGLNGKIAPFRESSFKSLGPVFPGDVVTLEIPVREANDDEPENENPKVITIENRDRPERTTRRALAIDGEVWVKGKKKAAVTYIELSITDAPKLD